MWCPQNCCIPLILLVNTVCRLSFNALQTAMARLKNQVRWGQFFMILEWQSILSHDDMTVSRLDQWRY